MKDSACPPTIVSLKKVGHNAAASKMGVDLVNTPRRQTDARGQDLLRHRFPQISGPPSCDIRWIYSQTVAGRLQIDKRGGKVSPAFPDLRLASSSFWPPRRHACWELTQIIQKTCQSSAWCSFQLVVTRSRSSLTRHLSSAKALVDQARIL